MFTCHLYILFGEVSVKVFALLKLSYFLIVEF